MGLQCVTVYCAYGSGRCKFCQRLLFWKLQVLVPTHSKIARHVLMQVCYEFCGHFLVKFAYQVATISEKPAE